MALTELAGETFESFRRRPAPALRGQVAFYSGYRQAGGMPGRHRGLPSPYVTFIVTLDDPLVVAAPCDPRQAPDVYETLVGGLHTTPTIIAHDGAQSGIQLSLEPPGVQALLGGVPAGELVNIDVHACELLGGFAAELTERVRLARTWPERFAVLDALLQRRLDPERQPRAEAAAAWDVLARSRGQVSIADLADELGWSERYLSQRFASEFGLSPKVAARVMRFDRARRLLQQRIVSGAPPRLTDLALECGYYDQAHLTREFCEMAGCSPSRWVVEELRNIQAFSDELPADSRL
jgi:AraC-like DNA-binding protein